MEKETGFKGFLKFPNLDVFTFKFWVCVSVIILYFDTFVTKYYGQSVVQSDELLRLLTFKDIVFATCISFVAFFTSMAFYYVLILMVTGLNLWLKFIKDDDYKDKEKVYKSDLLHFAIENNNAVAFSMVNHFEVEQKESLLLRKINTFLLLLIPVNIYCKGALYSVLAKIGQQQDKGDFIGLIIIISVVYLALLVYNTVSIIKYDNSSYIRVGAEIRRLIDSTKN